MPFPLGDLVRIDHVEVRNCLRKVRHATWREAYAHQESLVYRFGADPVSAPASVSLPALGDWQIGSRRLGEVR